MRRAVTAIVPAREESAQVRRALEILTTYPGFREVVVVTSGKDDVEALIKEYTNVRQVHWDELGKGQAMEAGVRSATTDYIFFCDADIYGLTHDTIDRLLSPVLDGHADMCVAVRGRRLPRWTRFLAYLWPTGTLIAGERALHRRVWETLPEPYKRGFRAEHGLNVHVQRNFGRLTYRLCPEIRQVIKEQKYGLARGVSRRLFEIYDIAMVLLVLLFSKISR